MDGCSPRNPLEDPGWAVLAGFCFCGATSVLIESIPQRGQRSSTTRCESYRYIYMLRGCLLLLGLLVCFPIENSNSSWLSNGSLVFVGPFRTARYRLAASVRRAIPFQPRPERLVAGEHPISRKAPTNSVLPNRTRSPVSWTQLAYAERSSATVVNADGSKMQTSATKSARGFDWAWYDLVALSTTRGT